MGNVVPTRQLIGEALAQLPAEHRAVICRSYYAARTTVQIADELHITDDTVKSRLHDALRELLLTLQEKGVTR
jgi:RNA polymerase sigma-70 factor, ECF subfamily